MIRGMKGAPPHSGARLLVYSATRDGVTFLTI